LALWSCSRTFHSGQPSCPFHTERSWIMTFHSIQAICIFHTQICSRIVDMT
jgi:hypothetical protein